MGSEIDILEPNYRDERRGSPPRMAVLEETGHERHGRGDPQTGELWEQAGRPDGRSDEFWFAARYEFERREETGETQGGAPVRRRVEAPRHESAADWGKRPRGFEM